MSGTNLTTRPAATGRSGSPVALAGFGAATLASALVSARYSPAPTHPGLWLQYRLLRKPSYTPPDWAFGIWGPLYAALTWSGYEVWKAPDSPARSRALLHWGGIQVLDAFWLWLGFGRRNRAAVVGVAAATVANAVAYVATARTVQPKAAAAAAPYAAWVAFAALLSEEIWRRN